MSKILIPLYVYPAPGAWDPLYRIIENRPDLSFIVVVNPNNGPFVPGLNGRPDDNYMRELQRLNTYRLERDGQHLDESSYSSKEGINGSGIVDKRIGPVRIIGYVATTYGRRSADSIKRDIDTYASWSELKCASSIDGEGNENRNGTSVQGVFFDETPNGYDPDTAEHLASLHAAVKEHSGLGDGFVVDNPGCLPDERMYDKNTLFGSDDGISSKRSFADLVDLVVVFEDSYATFNSRLQSGEFARLSPSSPYAAVAIPRAKRACIVHSVPTHTGVSSSHHLSTGSPSSFTKFLTSLSPKSSASSLNKKKKKGENEEKTAKMKTTSSARDVSNASDGGHSSCKIVSKGKQVEDKKVAALGRSLAGLAETVYLTDVERDYYAKFSKNMEMLCGPWDL